MRKACAALSVGLLAILVGFGVAAKETLLIYTSTPVEIMTKLEQMFEATYPDIDLQVFRSGTGNIAAKLAAEREAGKIQADLIWVAEYTYLEELKAQNLLYKYESPEAKNIPALLVDKDGYYYGARIFALVIAYNTNFVKDPPRTWTDLLDPKWKGQIVTANPSYSGSNAIAAAVLGMEYGLDYFRGLAANKTTVVQGNSQSVTEVAAGAYLVGLTLDNMVRGLKAQGSPIDLVYPDDGPIFLPSPIGIFATSERIEAALWEVRLLEDVGFRDIVISIKAHDVLLTVDANRRLAREVDYPLHLGITEAGTPWEGAIRSAVALGILLSEGIGDTIRVSLSGDPVREVAAAWEILGALGLRKRGPSYVVCPTCGRTKIDIAGIAQAVRARLAGVVRPLTIAVMGCPVNGLGEAERADFAILGGQGFGTVYAHGKVVLPKVPEDRLVEEFVRIVREEVTSP